MKLVLEVYPADRKGWAYRLLRGKKILMQGLESYRREDSAIKGAQRLAKAIFVDGIDVKVKL
jgi:hypothetical protein